MSPCVDAADAAFAPALDYEGQPWLGAPDIGADEYQPNGQEIMVAPLRLNYGAAPLATTPATQSVVISNMGTAPLGFVPPAFRITGLAAADYAIVNAPDTTPLDPVPRAPSRSPSPPRSPSCVSRASSSPTMTPTTPPSRSNSSGAARRVHRIRRCLHRQRTRRIDHRPRRRLPDPARRLQRVPRQPAHRRRLGL